METRAVTRFCGQDVSEDELAIIREVVADCQGLSRRELAATVCEVVGWLRPSGSPKTRECWELLEGLDAAGMLVLPGKQHGGRSEAGIPIPATEHGDPGHPLEGAVHDLAPILLERVTEKGQRRLWRELIDRHHYLGHAVPFGAHLRYLVWASRPERTLVACVQVSSPAWRMGARDQWIGWDDGTRAQNLQLIVCNSRFLILPWIKVRNLASTVLSRLARQVGADWAAQYGLEPLLLETLVDAERFEGTCYRAAGWTALGNTTGRGRMDREHRREGLSPKRVFVLPLVEDAPGRLRGDAPSGSRRQADAEAGTAGLCGPNLAGK